MVNRAGLANLYIHHANEYSIMGKIKDILRLTRIEHSLMLVIAVVAAEMIAAGFPGMMTFILSIITPVFISMGAFAINDYFDIETDRANKKKNPLIRGSLKPKDALYITAVSMIIGVAASAFINFYCLAIAVIFAALSVLYSYRLKNMFLLGNLYIAASMAIVFIFGSYVVSGNLGAAILLIIAMIFASGLAREINGTVRDMRGDTKIRHVRTLPVIIGRKASTAIAFALYLIAILITLYLFFEVFPFRYNLYYGILIVISDILVFNSALVFLFGEEKRYGRARNTSLGGMGLALIAILIATLAYI